MRGNLALGTLLAFAGLCASANAQDSGFGAQAALGLGQSGDLHVTSGKALPLAFGIHQDCPLGEYFLVKPRAEAWFFPMGHQLIVASPLSQQIDTKVRAQMAGADILYRFGGTGPLAVGGGVYLIRWAVDSTDRVTDGAGNSFVQSGKSSWYREGLGLIATCRLSRHMDLEARWVTSHDGYENLRTNLALGGLSWRF